MKIKQILTVAAVITALSAASAVAQTPAAPAAAPATPSASATTTAATAVKPSAADKEARKVKAFNEYKKRTVERLAKRADMIQKKQACATAATTSEQLHACFRAWHKEHKNKK